MLFERGEEEDRFDFDDKQLPRVASTAGQYWTAP